MSKISFWVFGYGSIIWQNEDIKPIDIVDAELVGAHRSFNKKSTVNRGTKKFPGLALGLEYGGKCFGKAFQVNEESFKILKRREGGYNQIKTPNDKIKISDIKGNIIEDCIVFFPNTSGKNYLNPNTTLQEKADIIRAGGQGTKSNAKEYLKEIKGFLNEYGIEDEEIEILYTLVFNNIM
ncbi:gamma-glutamylcyclotransferase [Maribacter sp. 2-571]|uniref:gamma-glutamylcyclotransferase n=1 Tax=Maribacter sp. 2-571 TaxID=3417569 RepID=UPI003D34D1D9